MTSTVLNVTFDCADPGSIARFWAAVTGWALHDEDLRPGHQEYSVGPPAAGAVRLYFVGVPEPKAAKNRLHLDLLPGDGAQQQEIARLVELGASVLDDQPAGVGWVILADPEGNEFCVEGGREGG
jgi:predicted enzyme related to lactoylglutathione lyase